MLDPSGPVLLVGIALLVSGFIKGCTGFGAGLLSVALVAQVFPDKTALAALTLPLWLNNVVLLGRERSNWAEMSKHWIFLTAAGIGTIIGAIGFTFLSTELVRVFIGVYLLAYLSLMSVRSIDVSRSRRLLGSFFGAVGGLVTGAILIGGPLFVSYLYAERLDRGQFITVAAMTFFTTLLLRMVLLGSLASFARPEILLGTAFAGPLFAGVYAGTWARSLLPEKVFERMIMGLLLVVGMKLLYDGATASSFL
jgi:uncharacterized membrane protein YfcA